MIYYIQNADVHSHLSLPGGYIYIYTYTYYIYICMYICIYNYRLKAGGSPELRGTLSLDAIPER